MSKKDKKIIKAVMVEEAPTVFERWQWYMPPFILATITGLFYYPSLYYAFQFDDLANIEKFYDIRHKTFGDLFFKSSRWISTWLNTVYYKILKFNPFYYRVGNVTAHTITGILVFFVIMLALKNIKKDNFFKRNTFALAFLTALLFLLHPVQTQTVSYVIQGQLEGLAGLSVMLMVLIFLLLAQAQKRLVKILLTSLLFLVAVLACGTKEIVIISPVLLWLIDWFFVACGSVQSFKKRLWLHAGVSAIIFGIYLYFLKPAYFASVFGFTMTLRSNVGNLLTEYHNETITSGSYCISQFKVIVHYLWIFIWPFNISIDYDWILVKSFFSSACIFPLLLLITIGYLLLARLKKNSTDLICWGALWFFVSILPRSSIIPSTELVADYKTYFASVGILFLFAAGIIKLIFMVSERFAHRPLHLHAAQTIACLLLVALPIGFATWERNKVWRSPQEFWGNVIYNAPKKARAYNNYGVALSDLTRYREAVEYFKKAIALDSKYPDPCNNLAVAYSGLGELDLAIEAIKKGIVLQPYYPEGYNNLASFLLQKKDYVHAEIELKKALQLRPHYGKAYFNCGRLYLETERLEDAWLAFKNCCTRADFDNEIGFNAFGMVSVSLGKYDDAVFAYKKSLEINSTSFNTIFCLGNTYFMKKDYAQAQQVYENLLVAYPNEPKVLYNLAETFAKNENFERSLELYREVEKSNAPIQGLPLRMAHCLDRTGHRQEAVTLLNQFLSTNPAPDLRNAAQGALQHLERRIYS